MALVHTALPIMSITMRMVPQNKRRSSLLSLKEPFHMKRKLPSVKMLRILVKDGRA